jgi:serine protease
MQRRRLWSSGWLAVLLGACAAPVIEPGAEDVGADGGAADEAVAETAQALSSGCTTHGFDGHQYAFCSGSKDWNAARSDCQSKGMDLVRIDSSNENMFVQSKVSYNSWTGANDKTTEGTWKWAAGNHTFRSGGATSPGFYANWAWGEPNNLNNEDCGLFYYDGTWNDEYCTTKTHWACEQTADLCPSDAAKTQPGTCGCGTPDLDPDGDGVASCADECPLDSGFALAGSCGCPSAPKPAGTACTDSVCGGNGVCDGAGQCGTPNACKPDSSCTLKRLGGSVYWLCTNQRNFDGAKQKCQSVGMDLAVVDHAVEDAFLRSWTWLEGQWIGARKTGTSKWEWQPTRKVFWNNGATVSGGYSGWTAGHPSGKVGDCAYIEGFTWQWWASSCSQSHSYACERTTDWFKVDATVVPNPTTDRDDVTGQERIVGRMVDEDGAVSQFIESEIMLETSSQSTLNAFLNLYGGTVVETMTFDPDPADDLQNIHQIRLDPARLAQASTLPANLAVIDAEDPGVFRVSSSSALRTLATFAEATVAGYKVEINWAAADGGSAETLSQQDVLLGDMHDVAVDPGQHVASLSPDNLMGWNHFSDQSVQHIGVGEAWQSLARAGRLVRNVHMAVLDSGFPSPESLVAEHGAHDYPDQTEWIKAGPLIEPYRDSRYDSGWHGIKSAYSAWGKANNDVGGAGPGYPVVAKAYNATWGGAIWTWKRMVFLLRYLNRNHDGDNLIVSISQSTTRRTKLITARFNIAVRRFERDGMLIVASAGNQNFDVDKSRGIFRERRHTTPCELTGVFCVGGIGRNTFGRFPDSNWGDSDVDIWAPWHVWVGPTPGSAQSWFTGTSAATPFVAGVAALVWAADPSLSSDQVKSVLRQTATVINDPNTHVTRVVDANAAVDSALRTFGPRIEIATPAEGSTLDYRFAITGTIVGYDAGLGTPSIVWLSNGNPIATGPNPTLDYNGFVLGNNTLEVRATYSSGAVVSDTVTVVRQVPDTLRIVSPADGQCVGQGRDVVFASAPPDPNVVWSFDGTPFLTGNNLAVNFSGIALGTHTVGAALNDGANTRTGSSSVRVVDPLSIPNVSVELLPVPDVAVPSPLTLFANVAWDTDGDGSLDCSTAAGCPHPFIVQASITDQNGTLIGNTTGAPVTINATGTYFVEAFIVHPLPSGESCVIASDGQAFAGFIIPI